MSLQTKNNHAHQLLFQALIQNKLIRSASLKTYYPVDGKFFKFYMYM